MLDEDVIEFFRAKAEAQGTGYQTMINATLRETIAEERGQKPEDTPLTVEALRRVLREELHQ